jgi:hypothetical protein
MESGNNEKRPQSDTNMKTISHRSKDRAFAALPVNAVELTRGDYILILFGQTSDGRSEEIDRYFFRVS